jgi:hypothetical protein
MEHMDLIQIVFFLGLYFDGHGLSFDLFAVMDNLSFKFSDCWNCFLNENQKSAWESLSSYYYLTVLYFISAFDLDIYSHFYLSLGSIYFLKHGHAMVLNN